MNNLDDKIELRPCFRISSGVSRIVAGAAFTWSKVVSLKSHWFLCRNYWQRSSHAIISSSRHATARRPIFLCFGKLPSFIMAYMLDRDRPVISSTCVRRSNFMSVLLCLGHEGNIAVMNGLRVCKITFVSYPRTVGSVLNLTQDCRWKHGIGGQSCDAALSTNGRFAPPINFCRFERKCRNHMLLVKGFGGTISLTDLPLGPSSIHSRADWESFVRCRTLRGFIRMP